MSHCGLVKVKPIGLNESEQDVKISTSEHRKILWSLEPLTRWMWVLGIPIPPSLEDSNCRLPSHLYRIFCFSIVLLIQSSQLIHIFYHAEDVSMAYMSGLATSALNSVFIIENFCLAVYIVGSHVCFLLLTRSKTWSDLINSFALLEESISCSDKLFISCRKLAVKLIIYLIFSFVWVAALLVMENIYNSNSVTRKIMDVSGFLNKIYPSVQLVLFCTLTGVVSHQLKAIRKRISSAPTSVEAQRSQLIALRNHHRLICKTVRKLNRYFGVFLTIEVGYVFVISITTSMYILLGGMSIDGLLELLNGSISIDVFIHLFLLTSFSDDIVSQTDKVYEALLQLLYHHPSLQNEVSLFTEQLTHMRPQISAFGFFAVGKHLLPSLIGTTLTYFLILLQFHSAEKPP
ncbi:putative gustatory receptor 2a [Daphnia pulex]|uniref:putative gustatory receptor 2a n=1 Tax=Daphnia pulex TaxID=6669 RepID=UPI001EDD8CBC|nr:putative gustatory receptor 2a [Daphnia pulex]